MTGRRQPAVAPVGRHLLGIVDPLPYGPRTDALRHIATAREGDPASHRTRFSELGRSAGPTARRTA